ncbi:SGNH/GDSL hydrolase family protein [Beggiatoa leptomitoformis]|uniref:Uncharacterized protein n=1 Tax=Beggiatoa leptomitoformis TaxID=288004 RepID=A0A2N9YBL6_9GAMM|nr:SGNH/GDSL hydrolase family protein [Beggiatoa leptomitoformis]ALG66797.1 hypothetical protein AL038_02540 [Beggiatoa leptomitoformis]AUI67856.1 hypothetical protein BLE401_03505 [Beggiatoa leptomitoformis]
MRYFTSFLLIVLALQTTISLAQPYKAIYVFGDSLSDTGRIYQLTGGKIPTSPPYSAGRFSNGQVWVEYLAEKLQLSYNASTNFAWGGAETGSSALPQGLQLQVSNYLRTSPQADTTGLYFVWAGSNDFFSVGSNATDDDIQQIATNMRTAVEKLHNAGARYIVVINVPDLGLTPAGQAENTTGKFTDIIVRYNAELYAQLEALGYPIAYVDIFTTLRNLITTPDNAGLSNLTTECLQEDTLQVCDAPDTYLFWDRKHPTTIVHNIIAEQVVKSIQQSSYALDTGVLHLPLVSISNDNGEISRFNVDLQALSDRQALTFAVTQLTPIINNTTLASTSTYSATTGTVTIPAVYVNDALCNAVLTAVPDPTLITFTVTTVSCE